MAIPSEQGVSKREKELERRAAGLRRDIDKIGSAARRKEGELEAAQTSLDGLAELERQAILAEGTGEGSADDVRRARERLAAARADVPELRSSVQVLSAQLEALRRELASVEHERVELQRPREQSRIEAEIQSHAAAAVEHLEALKDDLLALWQANQEGTGWQLPPINPQFLADAPTVISMARAGTYSYGATHAELHRRVR